MFEDDLSRTLKAVAKAAPSWDLHAGMADLRRRRKRRRAGAVLAACAVALVVAFVTALVRPTSPLPLPAATPSLVPTDLAERVTRATVQVPARSTDGREYERLEAIDAHRLLLLTERSIDMYDASTGKITPVAQLPNRADLRSVRANERHVVWMVNVKSSADELKTRSPRPTNSAIDRLRSWAAGKGAFEYWTVSLSGGTPRKLPQTLPTTFDLIGDDMISIQAGAYRTPLSDGPSQAISGAENAVTLDLPWVMLATEAAVVGQEPATLLNVATGQKRKLAADLCASMMCLHSPVQWCSSDWCIRSDETGKPIARNTGSSRTLHLPGESGEPPALNRFAVLDEGRRLFDLATGSSIAFDPPGSANVPPFNTEGGRRLLARRAGNVIWVLNLKAII